jgi:hypothetical protein
MQGFLLSLLVVLVAALAFAPSAWATSEAEREADKAISDGEAGAPPSEGASRGEGDGESATDSGGSAPVAPVPGDSGPAAPASGGTAPVGSSAEVENQAPADATTSDGEAGAPPSEGASRGEGDGESATDSGGSAPVAPVPGDSGPAAPAPGGKAPVGSSEDVIVPPDGIPTPSPSDTAPAAPAEPSPPAEVVPPPVDGLIPALPAEQVADPAVPALDPAGDSSAAPVRDAVRAHSPAHKGSSSGPIEFRPRAPSGQPAKPGSLPDPLWAPRVRGPVEWMEGSAFVARHEAERSRTGDRVLSLNLRRHGAAPAGSGGGASPFSPDSPGGSVALARLLLLGLLCGGAIVYTAAKVPGSYGFLLRLERPG